MGEKISTSRPGFGPGRPRRAASLLAGLAIPLLALMALLIPSGRAFAHAVYVFGWGEGDQICTDSYFAGKSPVRAGQITITSADGKVVASGTTDDKGNLCLPRPNVQGDLKIDVEAGEGHRAGFTLRAEDLAPLEPSDASAAPAAGAAAGASASSEAASPGAGSSAAAGSEAASPADAAQIRQMVREELSAQLGPINRRLTLSEDPTPKLKDVLGGLGWLAGFFGFAFFWSGRHPGQIKKPSKA